MAEFDIYDYVRMESDNQMNGAKGSPSADVIVYGDERDKLMLQFCHDPEDASLIERCARGGERAFFVKAYSTGSGRDGINIQTDQNADFTHLGYGPNSTAALRCLIALSFCGGSLQRLQEANLTVVPRNGNHLDMRRDNLIFVERQYEFGGNWDREYNLPYAKYKFFIGR